jgi:hypothetical protein
VGNNLDLCHMLGAPNEFVCPNCNKTVPTWFDDYDIDCGNVNPEPAVWVLTACCRECEHEWEWKLTIRSPENEPPKKKKWFKDAPDHWRTNYRSGSFLTIWQDVSDNKWIWEVWPKDWEGTENAIPSFTGRAPSLSEAKEASETYAKEHEF